MNHGKVIVLRGNALNLPLPDSSVDAVVTSPPYFGLRSYQDSGEHYQGQLGSEPTPQEFLDALIAATREMVRVLKPSGSIFVNLGDKYAGSRMDGSNDNGSHGTMATKHRAIPLGQNQSRKASAAGIPTKSLMGIPWRYAIRCIDELGLILRAEIIWSKPNGLPESVTDRVRRSHEQWFHMVKQPRYFSAVDEIREPQVNGAAATHSKVGAHPKVGTDARLSMSFQNDTPDPRGKLPGSVWTIPTQPLTVPPELGVDHFAAYPMEWPRRIIQGWSPSGICVVCGEGRRPVTDNTPMVIAPSARRLEAQAIGNASRTSTSGTMLAPATATITGYDCSCPTPTAPTRPAVILDPFGGTGTTALMAKALGRTGITIDLSADYCRLAEWRCNNPQELAAALQVEKPDVVPADQLSLFETP